MWAYAVTAPGRVERVEAAVPEAPEGTVRARLRAGGICGSDLPSFLGRPTPYVDFRGEPGFPMHEVVGITESGARIVGWAVEHRGLAEHFLAWEDQVIEIDDELSDVEATVIQPLCTVLHQLDKVDVAGKRVAVLGQGPIGLLFSHACTARGAAHVTGVDRVDRRDCGADFGVDEVVFADASAWAEEAEADVVIEAIGHHAGTLEAAVEALAPHGTLLAFGVPDESHYAFPFAAFFRKHATMIAGAATERARALHDARAYLREHKALLAPYVTHVLAVEQAQEAFALAVDPVVGRLKVVLEVR